MPSSADGFGTGLIAASRKRMVDGHVQFDAIEAVILAYCPIIPYKVIHVVSLWREPMDAQRKHYQSFPLRPSGRLIFKALANRWGNVLIFFPGLMAVIGSIASATMERAFNQTDRNILVGACTLVLIGILLKAAWLVVSKADERIKDIIRPHEFGTSDPIHWPDDTTEAMTQAILDREPASSLVEVARRAIAEGHTSDAMLCVRIAMRDKEDFEARELFDRLVRDRLAQT